MEKLSATQTPSSLLTITLEVREEGWATITLAGELDRSNEQELRTVINRMLTKGITCVIFDMQRLAFMDSSGINLLAHAYRKLTEKHGTLALVACTGAVHRILEVVHLTALVPIYATVQQAFDALEPGRFTNLPAV